MFDILTSMSSIASSFYRSGRECCRSACVLGRHGKYVASLQKAPRHVARGC